MGCSINGCKVSYTPNTQYTEGVTYSPGTLTLGGLGGFSTLFKDNTDLGLSDDVPYNDATHVPVTIPDSAVTIDKEKFRVTVEDYTEVTSPSGLYTGLTNSGCMEGLSIGYAEDSNDVELVFQPPAPPTLIYNIEFPDFPDLDFDFVTIPDDTVDASIMARLPDLHYTLEPVVTSLIDDVLISLSTDDASSLNDKIYNSSVALSLTLRGIAAPQSADLDIVNARNKKSFIRDMLILNRKANNSTTAQSALSTMNSTAAGSNAEYQQGRLDAVKSNLSVSMQKQVILVLAYNVQVKSANAIYLEYDALVRVEVKKLELYRKELVSTESAIDGNSELAAAYKAQLGVVQQVFESFEQDMKLSELALKLITANIQIESDNIKTDSLLIDGQVDNKQNIAYQKNTQAKATGMQDTADIAKSSVDVTVARAEIDKLLLDFDHETKNIVIDSENVVLNSIAESVKMKIRAIQTLFDLENTRAYNRAYNDDYSSHSRNVMQQADQQAKADSAGLDVTYNVTSANKKSIITSGRVEGYASDFIGVTSYIDYTACAGKILSEANTKQTLNHTISG